MLPTGRHSVSMPPLEDLLSISCSALVPTKDAQESVGLPEPHAKGTATLGDLRRTSRPAVFDFWTTRCINCPAALDSLDAIARDRPGVAFAAINIDDSSAARDLIRQAASNDRWTNLRHAFLAEDEKEVAKDLLGMRSVPFYVVVGEDGTVLCHGNAKAVTLSSAEVLDSVLSKDYKENKSELANASSISAASAPSTKPGLQCEGGVCRLVRPDKQVKAHGEAASVRGDGDVAGATASVADLAVSDAAQERAPGDCDGGMCKVVRRNVVDVPAASEASKLQSPSAGRAMQCEGGVCKLVRREKPPADASEIAAGKEDLEPLAIGSNMPSLSVVHIDRGHAEGLDDIRAGRRAILDLWTTQCVRCPAALDSLEVLAAADAETAYVSVNLDDLGRAKDIVAEGRWPSMTHIFAGREEDAEALNSFKARAGVKSVPFYVVLSADGHIEQMGGPKDVNLARGEAKSVRHDTGVSTQAAPSLNVAPAPARPSFAFTLDEDF